MWDDLKLVRSMPFSQNDVSAKLNVLGLKINLRCQGFQRTVIKFWALKHGAFFTSLIKHFVAAGWNGITFVFGMFWLILFYLILFYSHPNILAVSISQKVNVKWKVSLFNVTCWKKIETKFAPPKSLGHNHSSIRWNFFNFFPSKMGNRITTTPGLKTHV